MGFIFATTQFPGFPIGLFSQSKYRAMCNWPNNLWWRLDGQSIFRVIFDFGTTWYHSFRVQFVSDLIIPNTKRSLNVCIYYSVLSSKIRLGVTRWYMKPMPVILFFSAACDSLLDMWNFDCNPFLVRK